ncbi:MAG: hypothetical protein BJG00_019135 [Limnothrix sp. CACIAM 69d]|nr:MAG: hypothetical protein BJG00_019135 [Limnothrix sp. CACIAM 69d]
MSEPQTVETSYLSQTSQRQTPNSLANPLAIGLLGLLVTGGLLGGAIGILNLAAPQAIAQTRPSQPSAPNVLNILRGLPQSTTAPANRPAIFAANAYGQQSLNFQSKSNAEAAIQFYRQALGRLGYTERTTNTTIGQWGFSIVFDPPASLGLKPSSTAPRNTLEVGDQVTVQGSGSPSVVLVLQGTMLSPDTMNTNIRFEEIESFK